MIRRSLATLKWYNSTHKDCISHYKKHGEKIGVKSKEEYHDKLISLNNSPDWKLGKDGRLYYYGFDKNGIELYAVKDQDGAFRTLYKPDPVVHEFHSNEAYFESKLMNANHHSKSVDND